MNDLFLWPAALPLLLAAPLLWLVLAGLDRRRRRRVEDVAGRRADALAGEVSGAGRRRARALCATGVLVATLAVLQPTWGFDRRRVERRGIDLVLCLDVSRSMLARDVEPSRLQRARDEIRKLTEHVRGDRLALVVLAGEARLAVPLTRDSATFADLADQADPLSVATGGTDLGAALDTALAALDAETKNHAAVILITDGEDHGGAGLRVAQRFAEHNVALHCAGVGSTLGSKIAVADGAGERFVRAPDGQDVVSAMDPRTLAALAAAAGGAFVDASTAPRPLVALYERSIRPLAETAFEAGETRRKNRFQWPLLLAFLLWLLELSIADRRRRGGARGRR